MEQISVEEIGARYLFCDPAGGKKSRDAIKSQRARSAIVVVGTDNYNRIFVLDSWASRASTNEIRKKFVDMCEKWGPKIAAYEALGQQRLLADPILDEAAERGLTIPLTAVTPTTKVDKRFRIRALLNPLIGQGRLLFDKDQIELINEVTSFPMSSEMDMVDALASACALVPPMVTDMQAQDDAAELARYLRESGVPPSEIERRLQEVGGYNSSPFEGNDVWRDLRKMWNQEK